MTLGHVVDRKMREMGYIRKPALDKLKNRRSWRDRVAAEGVPEVRFTITQQMPSRIDIRKEIDNCRQ